MSVEHSAPIEFRASTTGRSLYGDAIVYGDRSPSHRERFVPGSIRVDPATSLNLQHDRARRIAKLGEGLSVRDTEAALEVRAALREGSAELALVRRGVLRGLSLEFHAERERRENGIRVIEAATVSGIALVDQPSYPGSTVELRARSGRTMRATIPAGKKVECRCAGVACRWAEIIGPAMQEMFDEVFERATRQIIAGFGNYDAPLASTATGTIRGRIREDGDGEIEIDLPVGPEGDLVLRAHENSGVIVRPHLDSLASEGVEETRAAGENIMRYTKASMRALLISSTDARIGWPTPAIVPTPGMDEVRAAPAPRRRAWLWL